MTREISGLINSENPSDHWRFLPVQSQVVLDLGSGINSEHTPTPMYWIQKEAKMVYGVDPSQESYNWYKQNFNVKNFIQFCDYVDRLEKFSFYFDAVKPDVAKIDVEGSEIFLMGLKPESLQSVRHIGIEYHNLSALLACEHLFKENGYEMEYYKFPHLDIDYQGVIYGHKKSITYKQRTI